MGAQGAVPRVRRAGRRRSRPPPAVFPWPAGEIGPAVSAVATAADEAEGLACNLFDVPGSEFRDAGAKIKECRQRGD